MPLNKPATNKTSSDNLFAGLIIFVGLALGYFFYSNASNPVAPAPSVSSRQEIPADINSVHLDFSIFNNVLFQQLKVFGAVPVSPGQSGRDNPFAPF